VGDRVKLWSIMGRLISVLKSLKKKIGSINTHGNRVKMKPQMGSMNTVLIRFIFGA